ncbi:hypothetical protein ACJJTC_016323 [Scirpophaga incertulas]
MIIDYQNCSRETPAGRHRSPSRIFTPNSSVLVASSFDLPPSVKVVDDLISKRAVIHLVTEQTGSDNNDCKGFSFAKITPERSVLLKSYEQPDQSQPHRPDKPVSTSQELVQIMCA